MRGVGRDVFRDLRSRASGAPHPRELEADPINLPSSSSIS